MKINIWSGYHDQKLPQLIKDTWDNDDLLIICPPLLNDYSFTKFLPKGDICFCGPSFELEKEFPFEKPQQEYYVDKPILGVFTSGTVSGHARLILYSKKNIIASLDGILSVFDSNKITSIFCYPQPTHTFGLLLGYILSLHHRVPLYFSEGKYGQQSHSQRLYIKDPGLLTLGTPTHFHDLISYVEKHQVSIAPSYSCIIGGAPVTVSLWNDIQKKLIIESPSIGYGSTEASPGITHHPPGLQPLQDSEIGFPLRSIFPQPMDSKGVVIKGPSLCLAIIQDHKIQFPKEVVISDKIKIRNDGMWVYEGRLDLLLNRGGQKFSLELIEQILFKELGVEVACSSVKDSRLGNDLAMLVKTPPEKKITVSQQIQDKLKDQFGFLISVNNIISVFDFPLNESLKLDRKALSGFIERHLFEYNPKFT